MNELKKLIGTWTGTGYAQYPTINPVHYSEELIFSSNNHDDVLQYEQRTWVIDEQGNRAQPIFWECGFIVCKEDETLMINTQKSGRIEDMTVEISKSENDDLKLIATSKNYLNDDRMVSSTRTFLLSGNTLSYELRMQTTLAKVDSETDMHLQASLSKQV